MIRHGPAFAFWLNYLDHHGGLWEQSGDTVLAILPGHLSDQHDLPESALITDDPDIATRRCAVVAMVLLLLSLG